MERQTQSPFFSLPPELREMRYKLSFEDTEVYIKLDRPRLRSISSNVLLTCKQIHNEAAEVFYRTVTFEFPGLEQAVEWMGADISKAKAAMIKKVTVWIPLSRIIEEVGKDSTAEKISSHYASELTEAARKRGILLKNLEMAIKTWHDYSLQARRRQ